MFRGGTEIGFSRQSKVYYEMCAAELWKTRLLLGRLEVPLFGDTWIKNKISNIVFQAELKHVGGIRS